MKNLSRYERLGKIRIDQLDGLRGVCAIVVLIHHMIQTSPQEVLGSPFLLVLLSVITVFGHIAVDIFFILSGFVIGYTTPEKYTPEEAKKYVLRRIIRLYPIYLFAIFFSCLFLKHSLSTKNLLGTILFMQGWFVPELSSNISLWSLHYEFIFYIIFLLIWRFNLNIKNMMILCLVSAVLSSFIPFHPLKILGYFTLWLAGLWLSQNVDNSNLINRNWKSTRFWSPLLLSSAFIVQNIVSMMIYKYGTNSQPIPVLTCALLVVILTAVVASLITNKTIPFYRFSVFFLLSLILVSYIYHFWQAKNFSFLSNHHTQSLSILVLLFLFSFLIKKVPVVFFEKISYLGSFSYALYVVHYPIVNFLNHIPISVNSKLVSILCILLLNALGAILSISLAYFLESVVHIKIAKVLKKSLNL